MTRPNCYFQGTDFQEHPDRDGLQAGTVGGFVYFTHRVTFFAHGVTLFTQYIILE